MNNSIFIIKISERYGVEPEYLWQKFPDYAVFRHHSNRKWFAVFMLVNAVKIGVNREDKIPVLNVKAKPEAIGSLRMMKGIYPAYHMNKEHWVSLNLAEIDEGLAFELLDESFALTAKKMMKK